MRGRRCCRRAVRSVARRCAVARARHARRDRLDRQRRRRGSRTPSRRARGSWASVTACTKPKIRALRASATRRSISRSERVDLAKVVEATTLEELRASEAGTRALHERRVLVGGRARARRDPASAVHADVLRVADDRLDGAHPRAGSRQPVDPSDGGLHRSDGPEGLASGWLRVGGVGRARCARGAHATSGRMHRSRARARGLTQRRLRAVDLVQRFRVRSKRSSDVRGERPERSHATRNSTRPRTDAMPPRRNSNPAKELTRAC